MRIYDDVAVSYSKDAVCHKRGDSGFIGRAKFELRGEMSPCRMRMFGHLSF